MTNHNPLRRIAPAVFAAFALSACSDWTDVESITLHDSTLEEANPGLYESYMRSLREYKQSEHKIVIAKFDNKPTEPAGPVENLSSLPDSIDFVILNNPDNLNGVTVSEIQSLHDKGTRTLYTIDYATIEAEYQQMVEGEASESGEAEEGAGTSAVEEGGETPAEPAADGFLDFCAQRMEYYTGLFAKYGYDGINVSYSGKDPNALVEEEKARLEARQQMFFGKMQSWKEANPGALFFFEGKPQNLLYDKSLLDAANYIIIPALDAVNADELLFTAGMALVEGVPQDRCVFGVTLPSLTDDKDESGYFAAQENGASMYAVKGAALAVIAAGGDFVKAGLCIDRTQNDYYYSDTNLRNYGHVKEAVSIMNPSPLN